MPDLSVTITRAFATGAASSPARVSILRYPSVINSTLFIFCCGNTIQYHGNTIQYIIKAVKMFRVRLSGAVDIKTFRDGLQRPETWNFNYKKEKGEGLFLRP
jgi:hypothetical protein